MQGKILNITCDDILDLQKIVTGKKASLGHTYKTQTEANDKVWDLNKKTEWALEALAILYARFDLGEVYQNVDKEFEQLQDALENTKQAQRMAHIDSKQKHV